MSGKKDLLGDEDIKDTSLAPVEEKKVEKPNPSPSNEGRDPDWPEGYNGRRKDRVLNDGHDWKDFFSEEDE
tara:strand:+ start:1517 stop:1729 length:213 start_codon:yes stop_codon:yes gene_type:complete